MLNTEMFGDKNPIQFVYNYYTESIDTFNGFQWIEYNRTHAFEIYTKIGKTILTTLKRSHFKFLLTIFRHSQHTQQLHSIGH